MAWSFLPELNKIPASSEKVASGIPEPDPISDRVRVSWAASVAVNDAVGGRSSRRIITAGFTITCGGGGLVVLLRSTCNWMAGIGMEAVVVLLWSPGSSPCNAKLGSAA